MENLMQNLRDLFYIPPITISGLRRYQEDGVKHMLSAKRCLNVMDMGTGKTLTSIAAIDAKELYPAIVVCKASAKLQWAGEVLRWLKQRKTVSVLEGQNPFAPVRFTQTFVEGIGSVTIPVNDLTADIIILNYNIAWYWHEHIIAQIPYKVLTLDEMTSVIDRRTLFYKSCKALAQAVQRTLGSQHIFGLTGTPVVNTPADLIGILEVLGRFHEFGSSHKQFKDKYCGAVLIRKMTRKGMRRFHVYDPARISPEVALQFHNKLRATLMYRVTEEEAMPELPPIQRTVIPVELSNRAEYDRVREDVFSYVRELAASDREFNASLYAMSYDALLNAAKQEIYARFMFTTDKQWADWLDFNLFGLTDENQKSAQLRTELRGLRAERAELRARRAEALTRISHLCRITGAGKIEGLREWHKNFAEETQEKLILFTHYRATFDAVKGFVGADAAEIRGGQGTESKEAHRLRFQTDPDNRYIIISMRAGEDSLNLSAARHCIFVELPYTAKTFRQCEKRSHGRADNPHSIISHLLIAPGTVDEKMLERIEMKARFAAQITDGIVGDAILNKSILEEILDSFVERIAENG